MIRVILWDIDNTLLNFNIAEEEALRKGFVEFGLGTFTDKMLKDYMDINKKLWQALERGEITKSKVLVGRFETFFRAYGLPIEKAAEFNERYQELLGETICFNDHADQIVEGLKGKVIQCAASNGTKKAQTGKLKNSGLDHLLDLVFISEDVGAEKPSKVFFDKALAEITEWMEKQHTTDTVDFEKALDLSEILMVGDSLTSDMRGANNAGIRSCWYNPDGVAKDPAVQIDYEIKDLHEVLNVLC